MTLPAALLLVIAALASFGCQGVTRAPLTGTMDQVYADAVDMYAAAGDSVVYALDAGLIPDSALDDVAGLNDATRMALVGMEQARANGDQGTFDSRLTHFRQMVRALIVIGETVEGER